MRWDEAAIEMRTCMDVQTKLGKGLVSKLLETADQSGLEIGNQSYEVVGFIAHVVELQDELTGEIFEKVRVCFVTKDGKTYSTCSPSFVRGFSFLVHDLGIGPWETPLKLCVKLNKAKKQGFYLTCSEAIEWPFTITEVDDKAKKPKK